VQTASVKEFEKETSDRHTSLI